MGTTANGYALLYKHPIMVRSTLRRFLPCEIVEQFDLRTLRSIASSYVSENLRDRHGDAVWSVRRRDGRTAYLYLLLEFQTTDDPFMALRVLAYEALLLQDHVREQSLGRGDPLPAVFPLVLYNGSRSWRAPLEIRELFEQVSPDLEPYQPLMRYFLLDMVDVDRNLVDPTNDPASCLVAFEQSRSQEEAARIVRALDEQLAEEHHRWLRRDFASWLSGAYLPRRLSNVEIPEMAELKEIENLLDSRIPDWSAQWRREGREEGRVIGEGRMLRRQIERKFGPLEDAIAERIRTADEDLLLAWGLRLLSAERLEEVFDEAPSE